MKKKRRMDEPTRKRKRRVYEDEEESSDEYYEDEDVDIEGTIHDVLLRALEVEDWSVQDVVTLLCNEMKFVVKEYE
jgi:hypothetical protein